MLAKKDTLARGKGRPKEFDTEKALRAALRLFWEKGYTPTSIAELCQVMEINPPSLYCAFGNKAALFLDAVKYYESRYWADISEKFMQEPDIYRAVNNYFEEAARILLAPSTPCGCMLVLAAVNIAPEEKEVIETIRSMRMETTKMFSNRLRKAIQDTQIPADTDVPTIAGALTVFLEGMSLQAKDGIFLSQLLNMAKCAVNLLPGKTRMLLT